MDPYEDLPMKWRIPQNQLPILFGIKWYVPRWLTIVNQIGLALAAPAFVFGFIDLVMG